VEIDMGETRKKRMPIGISNYKNLIDRNAYFVDKTLFIRDIINDESEAVVFTRPRRFGKTLNLSMLYYYFSNSGDDNTYLFKDKKIYKQGERYTSELGKYPVIYLTFKDIKQRTWEYCYNMLKRDISRMFIKFIYLKNSNVLLATEKKDFISILEGNADATAYMSSLELLSSALEKYHKEKVMIFIDEYDTPLNTAHTNGYQREAVDFMRGLLSGAFKDNSSLKKGIITGINRIAKENIFSGLNNVDVYTVLDKKYSEYFGITEPEIKELLYYNDMELTDEVKKWYDGYRIGGYEVYNPWSIINYVNRKELQPYWVNTASNDLIIECLRKSDNIFKDKFSKLLNYESIKVRIEKEMTYEMLDMEDNIWGLFMNAGYITLAGENTGFIDYNIKIPNYEIQLEFEKIVAISANMTSGYLYDMFQALLENNIELFVYRYKLLLIQVMSYHDNRENAYHMFMLGLCASLRNIYTVKSNLEVGLGRSDIILIPKDKKYHPIIMEFKAAGKEDIEKLAPMEKPAVSGNTLDSVDDMDSRNTPETLALETLANEAIKQIKNKEYYKVFEGEGFKDILLMGIGHHRKQCAVKTEYFEIPKKR
jgi:hypothetical protein